MASEEGGFCFCVCCKRVMRHGKGEGEGEVETLILDEDALSSAARLLYKAAADAK